MSRESRACWQLIGSLITQGNVDAVGWTICPSVQHPPIVTPWRLLCAPCWSHGEQTAAARGCSWKTNTHPQHRRQKEARRGEPSCWSAVCSQPTLSNNQRIWSFKHDDVRVNRLSSQRLSAPVGMIFIGTFIIRSKCRDVEGHWVFIYGCSFRWREQPRLRTLNTV